MEYREPIRNMSLLERCEWFATQLGELLPAEHKEVRAFTRAYELLKAPVPDTYSGSKKIILNYDIAIISSVMDDLEKICPDLEERSTESEEWHILEEALAEIKRLNHWGR